MDINNTTHSDSTINRGVGAGLTPVSKTPHWRKYWPAVAFLLVILLLAGLYKFTISQFNSQVATDHAQHGRTSPHVHTIVHVRQKLLVGVDPANEPFSFKPSGDLIGFDVDLAKSIAQEMNVPVEFVEYGFASKLTPEAMGGSNPLTGDKVDIVISGITINRPLLEYYAFSRPYLTAGLVAVTTTANTTIQHSSDLSEKRLGVIEHDQSQSFARTATSPDNIVTFLSNQEALEALLSGSIEALLLEAPIAQSLITRNPEIHIATDLLTKDDYAVMVMRNEDDLVDELNDILITLRQKGVLESLRHKWLE